MASLAETFNLALQHHQTGNLSTAEELYRQVLQTEPLHADSHHLLGVLAFQAGRHQEAVTSIRRALTLNWSAANYHSNLGLALEAMGKLDEAVASHRQALHLQPEFAEAHGNLGNVLIRQGKRDEALSHYQHSLRLKPDFAQIHCALGLLLAGQGSWSEAHTHYRLALHYLPDFPEAHNNLGDLLHRLGRPAEAIAHFQQALRIRPEFPAALLNLGNSLLLQRNWQLAEDCYRAAVRLDPKNLEALLSLGSALEGQAKLVEARRCYEQAVEQKPESAEAHNQFGNVLAREEEFAGAICCYQQALRLRPEFPAALNNLGCALTRQEDFVEAADAFRQALRLQPEFAAAHCNLGDALRRLGRLNEAIESCRQAVRIDPKYIEAHFNLALAHKASGNWTEALRSLLHALQLSPDDAEVHDKLGMVYVERGEFDKAKEHYERALSLKPELAEAHANLSAWLAQQGQLVSAENHLQEALRLEPSDLLRVQHATLLPPIYQSVDEMLTWRKRLTDHVQRLHDDGLKIDLSNDPAAPIFYLTYQGLNDRDILRQVASLYRSPVEPGDSSQSAPQSNNGKIQIGLISRCFRNHSVGNWMRGWLSQISRQDFSLTVLTVGAYEDKIAGLFKQQADRYLEVPTHLPSARRLIADQNLDVLVYTDIGTDPNTYTLAFSRLAPIQCTTIGHPVTTGLSSIDYFISTEDLETNEGEHHYSETLVRLKATPIYYYRPETPPAEKVREHFGLNKDDHVYACLQSLFKFHPEFDELLGGILRGDPKGVLLISRGKVVGWEQLLRHRFAATLSDVADRIRFLPPLNAIFEGVQRAIADGARADRDRHPRGRGVRGPTSLRQAPRRTASTSRCPRRSRARTSSTSSTGTGSGAHRGVRPDFSEGPGPLQPRGRRGDERAPVGPAEAALGLAPRPRAEVPLRAAGTGRAAPARGGRRRRGSLRRRGAARPDDDRHRRDCSSRDRARHLEDRGIDERGNCQPLAVSPFARPRPGRCVVLGRGADDAKVAHWLRMGAGLPGYIGFAIGRTIWGGAEAFSPATATEPPPRRPSAKLPAFIEVWEQASSEQAVEGPEPSVPERPNPPVSE